MNANSEKTLLAGIPAHRYVGRLDLIDRLYLHAVSGGEPFGVHISSPPGAGASELLRQVYDRLFREQRFVMPFYFAVRPGDRSARASAARYVYEFLLQAVAFRRRDPSILTAAPDICELARMAPPADADWADRICKASFDEGPFNDERVFIRSSLAAPIRAAAAASTQVYTIVDDLHETAALDGGRNFIDEFTSVFDNAGSPFVIGTRRNFAVPELRSTRIEIARPERKDAASVVEMLASDAGVPITEQTRDLIAVQFGGNTRMIASLITAARDAGTALVSYRDVEQLYAEELLAGSIRDHFADVFERGAPDPGVRRKLIEMLYLSFEPGTELFPLGGLRERLSISHGDLGKLAESLYLAEVIEIDGGSARLSRDTVLRDYLQTRYWLDQERRTASAVAADMVTNALKRAPGIMAGIYRRESALGLRELLLMMDLQRVPRGLVEYRIFRDRYKGFSDDEVREQLAAETETVTLPQVSHSASLADHYPPFGDVIEPERATVGVGFTDRSYRDEDQIVWLAAEIDSKLEADLETASEWRDRLEAAADACGFSNYRIWLVAPEGFSDSALELLSERNGIGSSRRQAELLREFLRGGTDSARSESVEYEMVIPVGDDTELIAAHSLEEISRRYNFPAKAVNQIKTALVEACINAAEHGLSPDRKIYQKFTVDSRKIVITISNRGLRLADKLSAKPAREIEPTEGRRGWGLKLIRALMDEVRMESVDDGTQITMTKYIETA